MQEIQNHRLYNTKKDYVLDYLDRNTSSSSSVTYSVNFTNTDTIINPSSDTNVRQTFSRSLSNANLPKAEINEKEKTDEETSRDQSTLTKHQITNYERFSYIRNKPILAMPNPSPKYNPVLPNTLNKRAQSNSCAPNNRVALTNNNQVELQLTKQTSYNTNCKNNASNKCVSFDNLSKIENEDPGKKMSQNNCVIVVKNGSKDAVVNNRQAFSEVKQKESIVLRSTAQRSSSLAPSESQVMPINKTSIENNQETNFSNVNNNPMVKKFKQFVPQERFESELDRVFKVCSC